MKKILRFVGIFLLLIVLFLAVAPFLFKDKIQALVQEQIDQNLNAQVYYGDLGLSFFRNFPNARISIEDFGVIGKGDFAGDTLAAGESFALVVDLFSVMGEKVNLKRVEMIRPQLLLKVLPDGQANWDIAIVDSTAAPETDTSSAELAIGLESYRLEGAQIVYDDATFPMRLEITGMDHEGRGDFTLTTYDLDTETSIESLTVDYDGIRYLTRAKATADALLTVSIEPDIRLDFKENRFTVNELPLHLDGFYALRELDSEMDLTYEAPEASFRSLLSLVPGVYTQDFGDIRTEGSLAFDGYVKGIYSDSVLPGFGLNLLVKDAMFQYPDLPKPVTNIATDLSIDNPSGILEQTRIDLRQFHADLGSNPIDAQAVIEGLERVKLDGRLQAKLNLAELSSLFPMEGTTLRGQFDIDAKAQGVYDEAANTFPQVEAVMAMTEGYIKQAEYPTELSQINFRATLEDVDGSMDRSVLDVPQFHFELDGEPIDGQAQVRNFASPVYNLRASGRLDLEKLMQVYPIEGMSLKGKIIVEDFATAGSYAAIEAERYGELPTSGQVRVENLVYEDVTLPGAVTVDQGEARFTPERLELSGVRGKLGRSDYAADGYLSNYLAYALMENEPLQGQLNLKSQLLDLNEWMAADPDAQPAPEDTVAMEAFPIPAGIDLGMQAEAKQIRYDNLALNDFQGALRVADQALNIEGVNFGLFGSQVSMNGRYNTLNPARPGYNFYLNIDRLSIPQMAQAFTTVQAFAPALKSVEGIANTEFGISGELTRKLEPVYESLSALGRFQLVEGSLKDNKLFGALASATKLSNLSQFELAGVKGEFSVENGYIELFPIDLKIGNIQLNLAGRQSLSGQIDYDVKLDAPTGALGQAASQALTNLTGTSLPASATDRIQLDLKVGGTAKDPKVTGISSEGTGEAVKDALAGKAEDELQDRLGTDVALNKDSLKAEAKKAGQAAKDSLEQVAKDLKEQAKDTVTAKIGQVTDSVKNEAEKVLKDRVGDEAKDKLDSLKSKFGLPKIGGKKKN